MALPKALEKQRQEAEAIQAALLQQQQPQEGAPVVVTDAAQLPPATASTPPQEPAPQAQPAPPPPQEDYKHKFLTLQGMFNKEMPELRAQLATTESQNAALNEQLRALTAALQEREKAKEPPRPAADPEDVERFGADLVEMTQRVATQVYSALRSEFQQQVSAFDARLQALEGNVKGVSEKADTSLERTFYATLTRLVPDWQQVNEDERWRAWLQEVDSVYGVPRQVALDVAHRNLDADRVASVFNAYKAAAGRAPSMASMVSPPTGGAAPPPQVQQAKPAISSKFIHNFYLDVARGKYRGREAEQQRLEAEINQAAAEGRIV